MHDTAPIRSGTKPRRFKLASGGVVAVSGPAPVASDVVPSGPPDAPPSQGVPICNQVTVRRQPRAAGVVTSSRSATSSSASPGLSDPLTPSAAGTWVSW